MRVLVFRVPEGAWTFQHIKQNAHIFLSKMCVRVKRLTPAPKIFTTNSPSIHPDFPEQQARLLSGTNKTNKMPRRYARASRSTHFGALTLYMTLDRVLQDTRMVAAASIDRIVHVWSTQTHELLHRLDGHTESVYAVTFSHDGNTLVSGGLDKTIKVGEDAFFFHLTDS